MRIKVTEFYGGLGWEGPEVTGVIDEEEFKRLYGEETLSDLMKNGSTGDCIGQNKGMNARIIEE